MPMPTFVPVGRLPDSDDNAVPADTGGPLDAAAPDGVELEEPDVVAVAKVDVENNVVAAREADVGDSEVEVTSDEELVDKTAGKT
jgi:hypothetical protein